MSDYYHILQVDPSADTHTINAAYRRLAQEYHPDLNKSPDATLRMQEINAAYSVLSDPLKRAKYDQWLAAGQQTTRRRPGSASDWSAARSVPDEVARGPAAVEVSGSSQHLRIVRTWFTYKFLFFTASLLVLDASLLYWYLFSFSLSGIKIFLLGLGAIGLLAGYYVLAGYLNKTVIDVNFDSLTIKQGPLPFFGNLKLPSRALKLVYYEKYNQIIYDSHEIHAITNDQRIIPLLAGLDSREEALFIIQEIAKFLSIEEKPIKGVLKVNFSVVKRGMDKSIYSSLVLMFFISVIHLNSLLSSIDHSEHLAPRSVTATRHIALLWKSDMEIVTSTDASMQFFIPDEGSLVFLKAGSINSINIFTGQPIWQAAGPFPGVTRLVDHNFFVLAYPDETFAEAPSSGAISPECFAHFYRPYNFGTFSLSSYDARTGQKNWAYRYQGANTDLLFDSKSVYISGFRDSGHSKSLVQIDQASGSMLGLNCIVAPDTGSLQVPPRGLSEGGFSATYGPSSPDESISSTGENGRFTVLTSGNQIAVYYGKTWRDYATIDFSGDKLDSDDIDIVNQKNILVIYLKDSRQLFGFLVHP